MTNIKVLAISCGEENCNIIEDRLLDADFPIELDSVSYFSPDSEVNGYDILLIQDPSESLDYAREITGHLNGSLNSTQVFIVSDLENPRVLHTLLKMRVDGYVSTQDWDFEAVANAVRSIATFKTQAEQVDRKLSRLQNYTL